MWLTSKAVNSLGLILDIVGVCILFKFGFPQPDLDDSNKLAWGKDLYAPLKRKQYIVMSVTGLVCLVGGFMLQLTAIWM